MCTRSLQSCLTVRPCELQPARLLCPWDSPGKNGLPFLPPGDLSDPGVELVSLTYPALIMLKPLSGSQQTVDNS